MRLVCKGRKVSNCLPLTPTRGVLPNVQNTNGIRIYNWNAIAAGIKIATTGNFRTAFFESVTSFVLLKELISTVKIRVAAHSVKQGSNGSGHGHQKISS